MAVDPLRIVLALGNGGRGGMQAQVRLLAGELTLRGHQVTVAVGGGGVAPVDGADVVDLAPFSPTSPLRFSRDLRRLVRARGAHVVHGHGLRLAGPVAASGAGARVVTCHGIDPHRSAATVRLAAAMPVRLVACGEGPHRVMARHGAKSTIIDNALSELGPGRRRDEADQEFDLDASRPLVVLPARYSHQKNHAALLQALSVVAGRLGDRSPQVLFFGDGPLLDQVERLAHRGDVRLARCLPYRDDGAAWLSASDFFLLTSRWEGQPLVVLEALARGLSVATTTPNGVEDLIADGVNGRRVGDPLELAEVVAQWIERPDSRPTDAAFTSRLLERHRPDVVTAAHLALYAELVH